MWFIRCRNIWRGRRRACWDTISSRRNRVIRWWWDWWGNLVFEWWLWCCRVIWRWCLWKLWWIWGEWWNGVVRWRRRRWWRRRRRGNSTRRNRRNRWWWWIDWIGIGLLLFYVCLFLRVWLCVWVWMFVWFVLKDCRRGRWRRRASSRFCASRR